MQARQEPLDRALQETCFSVGQFFDPVMAHHQYQVYYHNINTLYPFFFQGNEACEIFLSQSKLLKGHLLLTLVLNTFPGRNGNAILKKDQIK